MGIYVLLMFGFLVEKYLHILGILVISYISSMEQYAYNGVHHFNNTGHCTTRRAIALNGMSSFF